MCKIIQAFRKRFLCPLQTVPVRSKEKMIDCPVLKKVYKKE